MTETPPAPHQPDPAAGPFVWLVWAVLTVWLFAFVGRCASRIPVFDEFFHLELMPGRAIAPIESLFFQHNEHRIPLPRALYMGLMTATGYSFKAPCYFNAGCLVLAAAGLLAAVRRACGTHAYTDALIPVVVLSLGHYENLLWGFQIQFVFSTATVLGLLALVIDPRFAGSPIRVGLAGLCGVLLPACGANGVVFNPFLAAFLGYVGVRGVRSGGVNRRAGTVALVGAGIAAAIVPLYFGTLNPSEHHPPSPGSAATLRCVVQMLAHTAGPAGKLASGAESDGWPTVGWVVLGLIVATGGLLVAAVRDPGRRVAAAGIGAVVLGSLALAGGVAHGRAGLGGVLPVMRYVTLTTPLAAALYLAWRVLAPPPLSRPACMALFAAAAACVWPAAADAYRLGGIRSYQLACCEADIQAGVPASFVADRYPQVYPNSRFHRIRQFHALRERGVGVFAKLRPDPPMDEAEVPLRLVVGGGATCNGTAVTAGPLGGFAEIPLGPLRRVFGIRVEYELSGPGGGLACLTPGPGFLPLRHAATLTGQDTDTANPRVACLFADADIDHIRLDLHRAGTVVVIRRIVVLSPR